MPTNRKVVFANEEYYHIFNRGVEKRTTFTNKYEFMRAVDVIIYYRYANRTYTIFKIFDFGERKEG